MEPIGIIWTALPQLPKVPEYFVKKMLDMAFITSDEHNESLVKSNVFSVEYRNRDITFNGIKQKTRVQERILVGIEWEEWVKNNIASPIWETSIRVSGGPNGATVHGAHTDGQVYRLYYLLSTGGDNVVTRYYQAPNSPVLYALNHPKVIGYDNMDELTEIDNAVFPLGSWVFHNGWVLHGVTGITGHRVNINVTLTQEQVQLLIDQSKQLNLTPHD